MPKRIPELQTPQGKLLIRHPNPAIPPFQFKSSLAKLGVREKLAAKELIDQWTVQFLSRQNAKVDPGTFKTVEQAIQDYLDEKRGTLDRSKESTPLTIQKISGILKPPALAAMAARIRRTGSPLEGCHIGWCDGGRII